MSVYSKENPQNLKQAIESMLGQSIRPDDFVIVCDGRLTRELDDVVLEYEKAYNGLFNVYRLPYNVGLSRALNNGILQCKNEIIARMDSDDISVSDRMEKELLAMEEKKADIVGSNIAEFDGSVENITGYRVVPETSDKIFDFAKRRTPFNHPTVTFKKSAVIRAGLYGSFTFFEDYALWVSMLKIGCIGYNVPEALVLMRSGDDMYNRRGGFGYVKCLLRFENHLRKIGFLSFFEYAISSISRAAMAVAPGSLRKAAYKNALREKS